MSGTMILAYTEDGTVRTMPVSDRDQFQPGVTTAGEWDAMDGTQRTELAAKGDPENIRQREQVRTAARGRLKGRQRQYGRQVEADRKAAADWRALPQVMYTAGPDGITEWERTSAVGTWEATANNVTVTERWNGDSNDYEYPERPRRVTGQPAGTMYATAGEARRASAAMPASAQG